MDGVLNDKLKYLKRMYSNHKRIKQKVKDVKGQFTCIWHNESYNQDRWFGWRQVFESTWLD